MLLKSDIQQTATNLKIGNFTLVLEREWNEDLLARTA